MRKFYSLVALLAILLVAPSVAVAQKTVTLKTSDPSLVTVMVKDYYSDGEVQTWTSGDLQVTLADWDKQLVITPVSGYEFMPGSDKKNGETWLYYGVPLEGEPITQYYSASADGDVYEFEVRKFVPKKITLKIDDYTHVTVKNDRETVELTSNETVIEKPAGKYKYLDVDATDEYLIASVKYNGDDLNGENKENFNSSWDYLEDNGVYEITTVVRPAKKLTLTGDPKFIKVLMGEETIEPSTAGGVTTWTVDNVKKDNKVRIEALEDCALNDVLRNGTESLSIYPNRAVVYEFYGSSLLYGENNYTVVAFNKTETRTAKCYFTIDAPEKVYFSRYNDFKAGSSNSLDYLTPEANVRTEIAFDPDTELPIELRPRDYSGGIIYRVSKLNKDTQEWDVVEPTYSYNYTYQFRPADGDEFKVEYNFPDKDINISFVGSDDQPIEPGMIKYVMINNVRYKGDVVTKENATVKFGSNLTIYFRYGMYNVQNMLANDQTLYGYDSYNYVFKKDEPVVFKVNATKAEKIWPVKIKVDTPEALVATYDNSVWDFNLIDLTTGEANFEMEDGGRFYYHNTPNYVIKSARIVYDDPDTDPLDILGEFSQQVREALTLEFTTEKLVRDDRLIVFTDNDEYANNSIFFQKNSDPIKQYNTIEYKPVAGEEANVFNFNAELDKPVSLEVYDSYYDYDQWKTVYDFPFIYLNGERIECPMDESGYSYDFMAYPGLDALKDGDVMKMFKAEPSTYEVSFKLGEGVEVKDVVTDGYTAVESVAEPLTLFQNTALSFALPALENERQSYVMTLNDEDVEVPADGKFSYKVDADKAFDISIYTEPEQGITNVNGDDAANTDVYNLQGILMIRNASKEQISNLPEGLYIVGDKKVIVK